MTREELTARLRKLTGKTSDDIEALDERVDALEAGAGGGGSGKLLNVDLVANTAETVGWSFFDYPLPIDVTVNMVFYNGMQYLFGPLCMGPSSQPTATVFQATPSSPSETAFMTSATAVFTLTDSETTIDMRLIGINYNLDGSVSKSDDIPFTLTLV